MDNNSYINKSTSLSESFKSSNRSFCRMAFHTMPWINPSKPVESLFIIPYNAPKQQRVIPQSDESFPEFQFAKQNQLDGFEKNKKRDLREKIKLEQPLQLIRVDTGSSPSEDEKEIVEEADLLIIYDFKKPTVYNNKIFYPVTEDYYNLMCFGRIIDFIRDVISIEYAGTVYSFKLGYKFSDSPNIFILNRAAWYLEIEYLIDNADKFPHLEIEDIVIEEYKHFKNGGGKNAKIQDVAQPQRQVGDKYYFNTQMNNYKFSSCSAALRLLPWIKKSSKVSGILLKPVENVPVNFYDSSREGKTLSGEVYYYVKKPYYEMRCMGKNIKMEELESKSESDQPDFVRKTAKDLEEKPCVISINYNGETIKFMYGYMLVGENFVHPVSYDLFKEEIKYIMENVNTDDKINIDALKNSIEIDDKYIQHAKGYLSEFSANNKYNLSIVTKIRTTSDTLNEFAEKIGKLYVALKYNNFFQARFVRGYYDEDYIHLLSNSDLFEGVDDTQRKELNEYVDEVVNDIIIGGYKYYDIPLRKKIMKTKGARNFAFEMKSKCKNISDVFGVDDVNIIFRDTDDGVYCYDVTKLYKDILDDTLGNYNPPLPNEFIDKVRKIYSSNMYIEEKKDNTEVYYYDDDDDFGSSPRRLNLSDVSETPSTPSIKKPSRREIDKDFKNILLAVREKIANFEDNNMQCNHCKIKLGYNNFQTIDSDGNTLKYCSRLCFDQSDEIRKKEIKKKFSPKRGPRKNIN